MWLTAILALFQAIPALTGGLGHFFDKYYDAKVAITTKRIGGDVDVAKSLVRGFVAEGEVRVNWIKAVSQSKPFLFLIIGFALPWMLYEWKVVVWDTMLGWGTTGPIRGAVGAWGQSIIISLFGAGSVTTIGHMYFNNRG